MSFSPGGIDWDNLCKAFQRWVVAGSGLPSGSVVWGQQDAPRPAAPAITMRISNIAELSRMWIDHEDNVITFDPKVVTAIDPTTNAFQCIGHQLTTGMGPIRLDITGTPPSVASGAALDTVTDYWLVAPDGDHLQLARTFIDTGGEALAGNSNTITPIDIVDAGTGTLSIISQPTTVQAGAELAEIARGELRVTLELRCHATPTIGVGMATSILQRVRTRARWTSQYDILSPYKCSVIDLDRVRAVLGIRDAVLFEPRAYLDVHFNVAAEELTSIRRLDRAILVNLITNQSTTVGS